MRGLFVNCFILMVINGLHWLIYSIVHTPLQGPDIFHFCNTFHYLKWGQCPTIAFLEWANFTDFITLWFFIQCPLSPKYPESKSDFLNNSIIRADQKPKNVRIYFQNPFALILHLLYKNKLPLPVGSSGKQVEVWEMPLPLPRINYFSWCQFFHTRILTKTPWQF